MKTPTDSIKKFFEFWNLLNSPFLIFLHWFFCPFVFYFLPRGHNPSSAMETGMSFPEWGYYSQNESCHSKGQNSCLSWRSQHCLHKTRQNSKLPFGPFLNTLGANFQVCRPQNPLFFSQLNPWFPLHGWKLLAAASPPVEAKIPIFFF